MSVIHTGVVGHPVSHSLSPIMHNAAYAELGLDWNYEAIDLEPKNVKDKINEIFTEGCGGLNVTMPYKHLAYTMCLAHGAAARLKSVNTLISDRVGKLHGYSTDGDGLVNYLFSQSIDLDRKTILVLGAGGASGVICDALVHSNARVLVSARKLDKALQVVDRVMSNQTIDNVRMKGEIDIVDWSLRNELIAGSDLIINATPIGMTKNKEPDPALPLDINAITKHQIIVDLIYNPLETRLLSEAKEKGCTTFNGLGMLIHQGALAFTIMTGKKAPIEVMHNAIRAHLKERV